MPGVQPVLVDEKGNEIEGNNVSGNLCIKGPMAGILRTTYGDHERCRLNTSVPILVYTLQVMEQCVTIKATIE
jgi:acyl-coenzyme A synthetase/AMP-(fatty) acid ligase